MKKYNKRISCTVLIMIFLLNIVALVTLNINVKAETINQDYQIMVNIFDPEGEVASNGRIEIKKMMSRNGWNWRNSYFVNENGQVKISGLEDGTYMIYAEGNINSEYTQSIKKNIEIVDGKINSIDGNNISSGFDNIISLKYTNKQLIVKVTDEQGAVVHNSCDIEIRRLDEYGGVWYGNVDEKSDNRGWFIGGLIKGTYELIAYPYNQYEEQHMKSRRYEINVNKYGTYFYNGDEINELTMAFGQVQIEGIVYKSDGKIPAKYGYIDIDEIINEHSTRGVNGVDISENGTFKIGGLEEGKTYRLRAFPNGNDDTDTRSQEVFVKIDNEGNTVYAKGDKQGESAANMSMTFSKVQMRIFVKTPEGNVLSQSDRGNLWINRIVGEHNYDSEEEYSIDESGIVNGNVVSISDNPVPSDFDNTITLNYTNKQLLVTITDSEGIGVHECCNIQIRKLEDNNSFWYGNIEEKSNNRGLKT